jgi:uncharacterized protein YbjT (DUF2867 family)
MSEKVFVAGATGAVGRTFVPRAEAAGLTVVPHVRPGSEAKLEHPNRVVLDLASPTLSAALTGCATVVQLIGTMRKRFSTGDTYETSDIGTTRQLVAAAQAAGVSHFVLLSSVGAGRPTGPYLQAKAEAEALVTHSGLAWTILRPSAFEDREGQWMPGVRSVTRLLGLRRYEPIRLDELADALVHSVQEGPLGVLEGEALFAAVNASGADRR